MAGNLFELRKSGKWYAATGEATVSKQAGDATSLWVLPVGVE